jgi:hypothetical protein
MLPIEEIPNENFEKELRRINKRNLDENVPNQQVPDETLYYYVERIIVDTSRQTMLGVQPGTQITVYTYYCLNEDLLKTHREGRIKTNSSDTVPYTEEDIAFVHPLNSQIEFEISKIQSRPTPLRFRSQASRTRVSRLNGTF